VIWRWDGESNRRRTGHWSRFDSSRLVSKQGIVTGALEQDEKAVRVE
jgi:hypothetical protein